MNPEDPPSPGGRRERGSCRADRELHQTGQRLEELTAGEVDTVADRDGRTFLLRRAQEQLRHSEAAKLHESERRFCNLLDNVDLLSLMLDREARVTYCNDYLLELTGWARDEVIGRDWFELFMPSTRGDMKAAFAALLADMPSAAHHENTIITRSGGHRLIRWNNTVLRSTQGEAIGTASIGDDITERDDSRTASRRQMESRYRGLLEAAPDAMVVVNQDRRFVLLNLQAEKQFGYRRDELLSQKVTSIIPEGFAERLAADGLRSAEDALAQQIGTGIELTARRKDGSEFPIEIMLSPLESAEGTLVTAAVRTSRPARRPKHICWRKWRSSIARIRSWSSLPPLPRTICRSRCAWCPATPGFCPDATRASSTPKPMSSSRSRSMGPLACSS